MNHEDFTLDHLIIEISNLEKCKSRLVQSSKAYSQTVDTLQKLRALKKKKESETAIQRNEKFVNTWRSK